MKIRKYFVLNGHPVFTEDQYLSGENKADIESGKAKPVFSFKSFDVVDEENLIPISEEGFLKLSEEKNEITRVKRLNEGYELSRNLESAKKKLKELGLNDKELKALFRI